jgi:Metallo-peptidase family M12B Reprolysin-like
MPVTPAHAGRLRAMAALILIALLAAASVGLLPVHAAEPVRKWPQGTIAYHVEGGMASTVAAAALQWNRSGARVDLRAVASPREADVVVAVDDRALRATCGHDCLGYTSTIGRAVDGRSRILLSSALGPGARPLAVWVAAHELGHVLGLEHRDGRECSLMSPRAFDTRCAPSLSVRAATAEQLACVPAPADVAAAARLYGGRPAKRELRCR